MPGSQGVGGNCCCAPPPTCPDEATLILFGGGSCGIPGASYTITGDVTASGSLSGGTAELSLPMPDGECEAEITVTITPTEGYGAAPYVQTITISSEHDNYFPYEFEPDAFHSPVRWGNGKFIPKELEYEDSYGTCTITWQGEDIWTGSYTYASSRAVKVVNCGGGGPVEP